MLLLWLPALAWASENAVQISFEQRIRNENWNDLLDYSDSKDDQRNQVRLRTRIWASAPIDRTSRSTPGWYRKRIKDRDGSGRG